MIRLSLPKKGRKGTNRKASAVRRMWIGPARVFENTSAEQKKMRSKAAKNEAYSGLWQGTNQGKSSRRPQSGREGSFGYTHLGKHKRRGERVLALEMECGRAKRAHSYTQGSAGGGGKRAGGVGHERTDKKGRGDRYTFRQCTIRSSRQLFFDLVTCFRGRGVASLIVTWTC